MHKNIENVNENSIFILIEDKISIVDFGLGHRHNPFSGQRMNLLQDIIIKLEENPEVQAVVLYGGDNRSFSVGGDFNEVSHFTGGEEVSSWIDNVNNLYTAILKFPKPIIAAIDGYAIGFGLQLALTCDYRIGSDRCELKMPEFAMGIACNFGGFMLEKFVSRNVMQKMVFRCEGVFAEEAQNCGIIHEVVPHTKLLSHSLLLANKFASYPLVSLRETKQTINKDLIAGLNEICKQAKISHGKSFASGSAQPKMKKIINKL
ncbi:MAG: enoyl-CoA hydratase/isomerase family protein [Rickettsiales endosymbiont of Dermacentor nuttalli]